MTLLLVVGVISFCGIFIAGRSVGRRLKRAREEQEKAKKIIKQYGRTDN